MAPLRGSRRGKRAISPTISTVIITCAIVVMLLITIVFANNYLTQRIAENEFSAMKQFMQTIGLQLDDVAWTIGRTQTLRYASSYGQVNNLSQALRYTINVDGQPIANFTTGAILFNMPTSYYNLGNGYRERIVPSPDRSFLQQGAARSVSQVFIIEIVPMSDGNFIRIVAVPSIRVLNSTITTGGAPTDYYNFYLPILEQGRNPRLSQSVTIQGTSINALTMGVNDNVTIQVDFPKWNVGFDQQFFGFDSLTEWVDVPSGSIMQFYTSEVVASLGLQG
jgi:hypothetical protein